MLCILGGMELLEMQCEAGIPMPITSKNTRIRRSLLVTFALKFSEVRENYNIIVEISFANYEEQQ